MDYSSWNVRRGPFKEFVRLIRFYLDDSQEVMPIKHYETVPEEELSFKLPSRPKRKRCCRPKGPNKFNVFRYKGRNVPEHFQEIPEWATSLEYISRTLENGGDMNYVSRTYTWKGFRKGQSMEMIVER